MNQAKILTRLLADYRNKGGNISNVASAAAFLNSHKPAGIGRINEVICAALIRQMAIPPSKPMTQDAPPAITQPAPHVIASKTITFPEVMPAKPVAMYREVPEIPETPATPEPEPAPVQIKDPATIAQTREDVTPPKKSLWNKLKFWKK